MPKRNILKTYCENTFYHLYNRGVDKREIFQDNQDYKTFLSLLKKYLSPPPKDRPFAKDQSLYKEIFLLTYCLMPNHFHLLVKQITKDAITKLIRNVCTNYVMYFNLKCKRVGTLFEGRYKAVIVDSDEQFLHLSRYIHLNPEFAQITKFNNYPYSSYSYFIGKKKAKWIKPQTILNYFNQNKKGCSYQEFVADYTKEDLPLKKELFLEEGPSLTRDGPLPYKIYP